jgi:hypothetical protein
LPSGKLTFDGCSYWHQLDCGFLRLRLASLRGKHRTVVRSAKILAKRELPIDYLALTLFPGLKSTAHCLLPRRGIVSEYVAGWGGARDLFEFLFQSGCRRAFETR